MEAYTARVATLLLTPVLLALAGCVDVPPGAVDHSATVQRAPGLLELRSLAVLPIGDPDGADGLGDRIEAELVRTLRAELPGTRVVDPGSFSRALARRDGYPRHFARWRASYERTDELHRRVLPLYFRATGARHLLLVRTPRLERRELTWKEMEALGCCFARRGAHYWRVRLLLSAELIDAAAGRVVWRGRGEAVRLQLERAADDPGAGHRSAAFVAPMVTTAALGLQREMLEPARNARLR